MRILAIDPGTTESAFLWYLPNGAIAANGGPTFLEPFGKIDNGELLNRLQNNEWTMGDRVVVEMVASFGQPVGKEVFETVWWIGRFHEAIGLDDIAYLYRNDVKKHLCFKVVGINDAVIRQALIDRFGPGKDAAIGKKKTPGPLYGIKGDEWAALALAVTFADQLAVKQTA